jgi:hypothetical protein
VAGNDDDSIFLARELGNDVPHREAAGGSSGRESIVGGLDAFGAQLVMDVGFELLMGRAADGTRAEGYDIAHVLHGALAVHPRCRRKVGGNGEIHRRRLPW